MSSHKARKRSKKEFVCEYPTCAKVFARQEHAARHHISVHTTQRPYQCDLCLCAFGRGDLLTRHLRTIHRDDGDGPQVGSSSSGPARKRRKRRPNVALLQQRQDAEDVLPVQAKSSPSRPAPIELPAGGQEQEPELEEEEEDVPLEPELVEVEPEEDTAATHEPWPAAEGLLEVFTQSMSQVVAPPFSRPAFIDPKHTTTSETSTSWGNLHNVSPPSLAERAISNVSSNSSFAPPPTSDLSRPTARLLSILENGPAAPFDSSAPYFSARLEIPMEPMESSNDWWTSEWLFNPKLHLDDTDPQAPDPFFAYPDDDPATLTAFDRRQDHTFGQGFEYSLAGLQHWTAEEVGLS